MSLNLSNLFTTLGRAGRTAYLIDGAQALQPVPWNEVAAQAWLNPAWVATLAQSYDSTIRQQSTGMSTWTQAMQMVLQSMVAADVPAYGTSLDASLQYLYEQMVAQAATVKTCAIGSSVVADAANVGTGSMVVSLVRYDGLIFQNTVAEVSTLLITRDSYTGGATAGQEPWQWQGAPNNSSLGTGVPCNLWDWDFPQGSNGGAGGTCISAAVDANASTNLLTNGDMESWDATGTPFLNSWNLATGTWGTTAARSSTALGRTYSLQLTAGGANVLTQQFNSTALTGATAGTSASITAFQPFQLGFFTKATGVISAGTLTWKLVDSSGTVLNNQAGAAQTGTLALTGLSTSWTLRTFAFQTPVVLPANGIVRLQLADTALAGANLLIDDVTFCVPTSLYKGGPYAAVFSNPATPFEAGPDPDGFTATFTNDRGGASYGATIQFLVNRLFQSAGLILPYSGSPSLADTLITGA